MTVDGEYVFYWDDTQQGYVSACNRKLLKEKALRDGIMHKATKNKKLSEAEVFINCEISKLRYKVELAISNNTSISVVLLGRRKLKQSYSWLE